MTEKAISDDHGSSTGTPSVRRAPAMATMPDMMNMQAHELHPMIFPVTMTMTDTQSGDTGYPRSEGRRSREDVLAAFPREGPENVVRAHGQ